MQLSYDESIDIINVKSIPSKTIGYSLNPSLYEIKDLNKTIGQILPDIVKVSITIDNWW